MAESESERLSREQAEIEAEGDRWAERSDAFLVGYVTGTRRAQFHTPAIVEIQRRELEATRELTAVQRRLLETIETFNEQSSKYERRIEWLTWSMLGLAVAQLIAAIVQMVQ